ncbi:MAG: TIGR03915 family putative DNA repair protein [Oscillospiraceae bacterium]|nr:TIGR03915 family putative DNA repair protein [Oscillospiraceae bacterium]
MFNGRDVIYCYDGSFEGLLCCVFESFCRKELPAGVTAGEGEQISFSEILHIDTDPEKARRVAAAIPKKISPQAADLVRTAFLTFGENKDLLILTYLQKGFQTGKAIDNMLADDTVNAINQAVLHCTNEAHKLKGFLRFSDFNGYLAAVIEPKNKVIPLIAGHFADRMRNENFLIYDKSHRMAAVYWSYRLEFIENIDFEMPAASTEEERYRELWRGFYNAIGIEERENPRCRMNMMPKRYWNNMTEMAENPPQDRSIPTLADPNT